MYRLDLLDYYSNNYIRILKDFTNVFTHTKNIKISSLMQYSALMNGVM